MNKRLLLLLPIFLSLLILFLTVSPTFADNDSTDPVYNTETGNYYQFVQDIGISWVNAESSAKELSHGMFTGQLAVITTQDENDFVTDLLPDESSAWIGLKASDGYFKWINEETFDYSNWSNYQPTGGDYEDYVELFEYNGKWNDTVNGNNDVIGYVVEYPVPQYNDIEPIYNPDNGHYYFWIYNGVPHQANDPLITWDYANGLAESIWWNDMQGHLVTITDEEEHEFVVELLPDNTTTILGLSDIETEGELKWVTGEPFDYPTLNNISNNNNQDDDIVYLYYDEGVFFYNEHAFSQNYNLGIIIEFSP